MEVHGFFSAATEWGGGGLHHDVTCLLDELVDDHPDRYGDAIDELWLHVYVQRDDIPLPQTLGEFGRRHAEKLARLPKVTFRRSPRKLTVEYASTLTLVETERAYRAVRLARPDAYEVAATEILAALPLLGQRLKASDRFDLDRFLSDATARLAELPAVGEWATVRESADRRSERRAALLDPLDRLGIDWSTYHPAARSLLDDPTLWSSSDDWGPNGNDTGADLLSARAAEPSGDPTKFLDGLLSSWGMDDPDVVADAEVALAFAEVKLRGTCPPEIARRAISAIDRQVEAVPDGWEHADAYRATRADLRHRLAAWAEPPT